MESYIKNNVSDITYMSELTPPSKQDRQVISNIEGGVKFTRTTYVHYRSVSCGFIKGGEKNGSSR